MQGTTEGVLATEEVSGKPSGMPWLSPMLTVKNGAESLDFYEAAFGFSRQNPKLGPDGSVMHSQVTWRDGLFMIGPEGHPGCPTLSPASGGFASPVSIYVYCDDVDALFERAVAAGATVQHPLWDSFWGDRHCALVDPDGHVWNFATNKGEISYDAKPNCES